MREQAHIEGDRVHYSLPHSAFAMYGIFYDEKEQRFARMGGGCYTFRYPIADKKVEWISFEVFGEGALYPTNFRYVLDGKQYIADRVETVCGWVKNTENMLTNDTRFAKMGYEDGIKHFNELALSKEKSCVKIYFRDFVQEGK